MNHFASIDSNNIVQQVIVLTDECITNPETNQVDVSYGEIFCNENYGGRWVSTCVLNIVHDECTPEQCRKYARIGDTYDETQDAFIPPQPYPSWILNDHFEWEPPIAAPTVERTEVPAGKSYEWDEEAYQADNATGWVYIDRVNPALEKLKELGITKEELKEILGL